MFKNKDILKDPFSGGGHFDGSVTLYSCDLSGDLTSLRPQELANSARALATGPPPRRRDPLSGM